MAIPTRNDVGNTVRTLLGDTQVSGGSLYTNDFQVFALSQAYEEMFSRLSVMGADRIQREGYYLLPANTAIFVPSLAGMNNFRLPLEIWERGTATAFSVIGAQPSTPSAGLLTLTLGSPLPSSVQSGVLLDVYGVGGISDDVNDEYAITVNSPTSIVLNGCAAIGTYTSGGTVVYSTEQWTGPLNAMQSTDEFPSNVPSPVAPIGQAVLGMYALQRGIIKFPPCNANRELKIEYELSSSLVTTTPSTSSDSMGVDDCLNFMSHRTGQYCARSKGNAQQGPLKTDADYFLELMLAGAARDMQAGQPIIPVLWRGKRNVRWLSW
jgi:hypothetical protein